MGAPENGVKKRNPYKIAFFVQLILFFIVSATLLYSVVDQGVSLTYMGQGYKDTEDDLKVLMALLPPASKNLNRKDLVSLLRKNHPEALIVEEASKVGIGFLEFEFGPQGHLSRVFHKMASEG